MSSDRAAAELSGESRAALQKILGLLAEENASVSSISDQRAWRVHVLDSLSALQVVELRDARRIADIGSGAGFPGLVLALALPRAELDLIESVRRKCEFIARAIEAAAINNAHPLNLRSEEWASGAGREHYTAVTARAVGRLATLAELASPLLEEGGFLLAWKGHRDLEEEAQLARASAQLGMESERVLRVPPAPGARFRHLHLIRKIGPTPSGLPRRPGMAKKRPRG